MQAVYMDCFYLPRTTKNNHLVVLCVCGTTKYVIGKPIKNNNSSETRDFLFDDVICKFGSPLCIHSDNGPEFKG